MKLKLEICKSANVLFKPKPCHAPSAAVAGFGLMLRDSSDKDELTWKRVR